VSCAFILRKHQLKAQEKAAEKAKASAEAVEVRIVMFREAICYGRKEATGW